MRIPATNRSVEVSYVSGKRFAAVSCIRCAFDGPMPAQGYVLLPDKVAFARKRGILYHKSAIHIQIQFRFQFAVRPYPNFVGLISVYRDIFHKPKSIFLFGPKYYE